MTRKTFHQGPLLIMGLESRDFQRMSHGEFALVERGLGGLNQLSERNAASYVGWTFRNLRRDRLDRVKIWPQVHQRPIPDSLVQLVDICPLQILNETNFLGLGIGQLSYRSWDCALACQLRSTETMRASHEFIHPIQAVRGGAHNNWL